MAEDKYAKITNTVYKIIDFFPEGEPLKNKTKEKALEIMEKLVLVSLSDNPHPNPQKGEIAGQALKDIEVLKSYLNFGKLQGWVNNLNLMIILKEYDKIKEEIKPGYLLGRELPKETVLEKNAAINSEKDKVSKTIVKTVSTGLSVRQKEILRILETQGKAQVADFKKIMPDISKRTLRRDLDDLLKKEKVVRIGEWNQIFYQIKADQSVTAVQGENLDRTHQMS